MFCEVKIKNDSFVMSETITSACEFIARNEHILAHGLASVIQKEASGHSAGLG